MTQVQGNFVCNTSHGTVNTKMPTNVFMKVFMCIFYGKIVFTCDS